VSTARRLAAAGCSYPPHVTFPRELIVLALAFAAGVGLAEAFGAINLGVAFGVGQIAFAAALVALLLRY
jgi:hypothetical protein